MIEWVCPTIDILPQIKKAAQINAQQGNDMSAANLFLYRNKYNTQICLTSEFLFRKYKSDGVVFYGVPLFLKEFSEPEKKQKMKEAIDLLDKSTFEPSLLFFHVCEKQLDLLREIYPEKIDMILNRDLFDYIYLRDDLANLPGSKYHKKKNHISKFSKKYPDAKIVPLDSTNVKDAWSVEEEWFNQAKTQGELPASIIYEYDVIKEALENFDAFEFQGQIIYIDEKPIAMTVASATKDDTMDIHFEKALMPFALDGAYAFINKSFANTFNQTYINREEDLGIEGLRKSKLSYYPAFLLERWIVKIDL
jgi:hypothetical protein